MKRTLIILAILSVFALPTAAGLNDPYLVVAVHMEVDDPAYECHTPNGDTSRYHTTPDQMKALEELLADTATSEHDMEGVELTIMMQANLLEDVIDGEDHQGLADDIVNGGHEIGFHHHGSYHPGPSGYSNFSVSVYDEVIDGNPGAPDHRGTAQEAYELVRDFVDLTSQNNLRSGTITDKYGDYPVSGFRYNTSGSVISPADDGDSARNLNYMEATWRDENGNDFTTAKYINGTNVLNDTDPGCVDDILPCNDPTRIGNVQDLMDEYDAASGSEVFVLIFHAWAYYCDPTSIQAFMLNADLERSKKMRDAMAELTLFDEVGGNGSGYCGDTICDAAEYDDLSQTPCDADCKLNPEGPPPPDHCTQPTANYSARYTMKFGTKPVYCHEFGDNFAIFCAQCAVACTGPCTACDDAGCP